MSNDIVMPNLGFDVQQARLIEWLKQPGDTVQKGEILAIVESDKANVELESVAAGIVLEQLVPAGVEVPVGTVIARVGQASERVTPAASSPAAVPSASEPAKSEKSPLAEISPVARKLAADHNIDLATVTGTGPRGRITKEDVETLIQQRAATTAAGAANGALRALPKVRKAVREAGLTLDLLSATGPNQTITLADLQAYQQRQAAPQPAAPPAAPVAAEPPTPVAPPPPAGEGIRAIPLTRLRQIIGKRLGESKREAPHFYVSGEFDLENALKRLKSLPEPRVGLNDLIQYITVQTLRRVPALNATFQNDTIYQYDSVNLAVAVARDEGLITPVLRGAERFSLSGLAQESRKLIEKARANKLHPDELQGGTFTISNLGVVRQVDQFVAIINPPQVAILAVGTVKQRPVVIDGGLHIRHTVHVTLSGDHRAVDGMHLAQFLAAFQTELELFSGN